MKILLVDDDLKNSMLLKRFIEAEGYEVEYAQNGRMGLELYHDIHPDLILLDVNMPEMNGFEVAMKIREADRRVIIFFLTDRTDNERFESDLMSKDEEYQLGEMIFRPNLSTLSYRGETHSLSVRQSEILLILARNIDRMVERETILNAVWGDASYSNSLALNVQITYLRKLLADPSVAITSLKKKGYILTAE